VSGDLGDISISEIQLPVPKIHVGIAARDDGTMSKLLRGEEPEQGIT